MTFQSVPDTVEVAVLSTQDGQVMENTFYGQKGGGYVLSDLTALAAGMDAWVATFWLPLHGAEWHYDRVEVRGLDSPIDLQASNSDSAGFGTAGSDSLPNNVAFAVKRSSGFTGRGARGRIFMSGIPEGARSGTSEIDSTFAAAATTALDAMSAVFNVESFTAVIVHRVSAGVPLPTAVLFTLVEWVAVNLVMDSMRRRLPGRGT